MCIYVSNIKWTNVDCLNKIITKVSNITCVVDALNLIPSTEQRPSPAATDSPTSNTPAIPIPHCELTGSLHLRREMHAYST